MNVSNNRLELPAALVDPQQYHEPLSLPSHIEADRLIRELRTMLIIRKAEEQIGAMVTAGVVRCPAHLGIGQEAIAVGVSRHLCPTDRIFGAHRSHSHFLAAGGTLYELFAEVLGRVTGASKGMGGSMHLYNSEIGFWGSVPIVGASVPIAVGSALAAQMDHKNDVVVSYFGDGAMEEGALHESLNLAATLKLPVLFVCENNLFSSHMHISLRQPANSVGRFAQAHAIPTTILDGNNVIEVADAASSAIQRARKGEGPSFLEAVTYRWRGHVGPREDLDVGVRRSDDLVIWKERDPILRLALALQQADVLSSAEFIELDNEVVVEVQTTWQAASNAPYPPEHALLDWVYA